MQLSGASRRIATKSAVVPSQARGNGVYPHFLQTPFPAVPAQEPAVTSTCRASLKALPEHPRPAEAASVRYDPLSPQAVARPRFRKIAQRVS